jgi:uncharacterized protein YndB with AHSA1/START domain
MKVVQSAMLAILGSMALPLIAQSTPPAAVASAASERVVRVEGNVAAPVSDVWRVWTTSEGAEEFFAQKANIKLAIGGPYEIQFDPADERSGTKGLKILSYAPDETISFQWNAPTEFPEVRNGGMWVVAQMRPVDAYTTHVTITHLGWKRGPEWDKAYAHFQRGWSELMDRLQKRFTDGPIDWSKQPMMYQESRAHRQ